MATIATAQSGDHNVGSTWVGGVVPGSGDNAQIGHVVTQVADWTIGMKSSDPTIRAIDLTDDAAELVLLDDVIMTLRGKVHCTAAGKITMGPGSKIRGDVPAGVLYEIKHYSKPFTVNGTEAKPCEISSLEGGGNLHIPLWTNFDAPLDVDHCKFIRVGNADTDAINSNNASSEVLFSVTNSEFDGCGRVYHYNAVGSSTSRFDDNLVRNSVHATDSVFFGAANDLTTGVRSCSGNRLDKALASTAVRHVTYDRNTLNGSAVFGSTAQWASFHGNFIKHNGDDIQVCGSVTGNIFYLPTGDDDNPHAFNNVEGLNCDEDVEWVGNIFYFAGTDPTGDMMFLRNFAVVTNLRVAENIVMSNGVGSASGTLISPILDIPNVRLTIVHNTANCEGTSSASILIGHGQTAVESPNRFVSVKSNLFWSPTPDGGLKVASDSTEVLTDILPPGVVSKNAGWNTSEGSNFPNSGNGYDYPSSVVVGTDDLDGVNPLFADVDRSIFLWAQTVDATVTSDEDVAGRFFEGASGFTVSALQSYIRAGLRPTNPAYATAAHDGGTIGAVSSADDPPGKSELIARMASLVPALVDYYEANASSAPAWPNQAYNHDPIFALRRALVRHPGNTDIIAAIAYAKQAYVTDHVVIANGVVQEPYLLPQGLGLLWELDGDTAARDALILLRNNSYAATGSAIYEMGNRGAAYAILTHIEADRQQNAGSPLVAIDMTKFGQFVTQAIGHIGMWAGDPEIWRLQHEEMNDNNGPPYYTQGFMMGLTGYALAKALDYMESDLATTDARIVPSLALLAFMLRERHWRPASQPGDANPGDFIWSFYPDGSYSPADDDPTGSTDGLNMLCSAFMGAVYKRTGSAYFKTAGDESFTSCVDIPDGILSEPKQYAELYRFFDDYLSWRDASPGADDDFYVAINPFFPRAVAGQTQADPIRVMPMRAIEGTITISDGEGWTAGLTWDGTAVPQSVHYAPTSAGDKVLTFTNDAGLTDPDPIAYSVSAGEVSASSPGLGVVDRVVLFFRGGQKVMFIPYTGG